MGDSQDRDDSPQDEELLDPQEPEFGSRERDESEPAAAELVEEVSRLREALLRTRAEMDNLQKRGERELDKARRFINEGLMKDLVPVLDTLDQALENAGQQNTGQENAGLSEGLELIQKQLLQSLERHGLQVINPLGEAFDPEWHEAMSMQPSQDHAPDSVMLVLQRGYTLHGRLLRAARVIVARGPQG